MVARFGELEVLQIADRNADAPSGPESDEEHA